MLARLSLRRQIAILSCGMALAILIISLVVFRFSANEDFQSELVPFQRQAHQTALALNAVLAASENPQAALQAFSNTVNVPGSYIHVQSAPTVEREAIETRAPQWFLTLFKFSNVQKTASYPIALGPKTAGYLVFSSNDAPDIDEKWTAFLSILALLLLVGSTTVLVAYLVVGRILLPLETVTSTLRSVESGAVHSPIKLNVPAEFVAVKEATNKLADALATLRHQNKALLNAIVSAQDQERDEIARDLHDELGPILFALRAHAISLQNRRDISEFAAYKVRDFEVTVSSLQLAYRQILDRLRPILVEEVGLLKSLNVLVDSARQQTKELTISATFDASLDNVTQPVARTIYRLIQESILNVQKHSNALDVAISISMIDSLPENPRIVVEISDNGHGFPIPTIPGRGLRGMEERVRALGGSLVRDNRPGAYTRCELPIF